MSVPMGDNPSLVELIEAYERACRDVHQQYGRTLLRDRCFLDRRERAQDALRHRLLATPGNGVYWCGSVYRVEDLGERGGYVLRVDEEIRPAGEDDQLRALTADNTTLRAEVGRLTAALEGQAEGRFIEGLREVAKAARYQIFLNFSEPQTPPTVVVQPTGTSLDLLEIFEEPTCTHPDGWSWEPEDWQPGPLARRVLGMLNRGEGESARPPERPQ